MTELEFRGSIADGSPPDGASAVLQALWWDARGDWRRAHVLVQDEAGGDAAAVHAYLHRREGDASNAGYWYRRAGRPAYEGSLAAEWDSLVAAFLAGSSRPL